LSKNREGFRSKQSSLAEHVLKGYVKPEHTPELPVEKQTVFTTERRKTTININRKHSIVKERCRQLTEIALNLFPNRKISHEDLTFLVISYIGGNRGTVRAYMGYLGRKIGSSWGNVKFTGKRRRGYLEIFGFMHRKDVNWIIHAQKKLVPPHTPPSLINECVIEKVPKK